MSDISSALSVAQRLLHVLDHLGLPKAHFALRYPLDLVGLLERAPERIASVVLQGATGRPEASRLSPPTRSGYWVTRAIRADARAPGGAAACRRPLDQRFSGVSVERHGR